MRNILDRGIFIAIFLMVSFPYERLRLPVVDLINVKSYMMVLLLFMCALKSTLIKNHDKYYLLPYVVFIFISYFIISIILGADFVRSTLQVFLYAPFLISCVLIVTRTAIPYDIVVKNIIIAVMISGVSASYIFYFHPDWLPGELGDESFLAWGRLPWRGGSNAIIVLGAILFTSIDTLKTRQLLIFSLIAVILSLLTFNRTNLLGILLLITAWTIFNIYKKKPTKLFGLYILLAVMIVVSLNIFDFESIQANIDYRVIGFLSLTSDITGHFDDRMVLYLQYYEVFKNYPILGAGFDVPFATYPETSTYSDITLVSFILPFGIFGALMFFLYIWKLWSTINSVRVAEVINDKFGLKLIIIIGLAVSFNDDIWSHKEFSIIIALLISSYANSFLTFNQKPRRVRW